MTDRLAGGIWGHLVADALGVPYEFTPPALIREVRWGRSGSHHQPPGTWNDDGGLMLALLDSLLSAGFDPEDQEARLYSTFFCRNCGQEHHPVVLAVEEGVHRVLPRDIDDTPLDDSDSAERPGYLMPEPENDADFTFKGELEDFPEDWLELDRGGSPRLRRERKAYVPEPLTVDAAGTIGSTGRRAWFLPGKFRFCPACESRVTDSPSTVDAVNSPTRSPTGGKLPGAVPSPPAAASSYKASTNFVCSRSRRTTPNVVLCRMCTLSQIAVPSPISTSASIRAVGCVYTLMPRRPG